MRSLVLIIQLKHSILLEVKFQEMLPGAMLSPYMGGFDKRIEPIVH